MIVTLNHIIVYKLLILDRDTWYYVTLYKQIIIDKNRKKFLKTTGCIQ